MSIFGVNTFLTFHSKDKVDVEIIQEVYAKNSTKLKNIIDMPIKHIHDDRYFYLILINMIYS